MKLGFGKHADDELEDVPEKYLKWLINSSQEKIDMCEAELKRRTNVVDNSLMARIVTAGTLKTLDSIDSSQHKNVQAASDALMKAIADAATGAA